MKHQYESELIEEIVDARGHKKSSLHYESECVETWIEEAKGAYPKLCDYESEWLKYISILDDTGGSEDPEPPIGEFPYVVLTDVTEATIDNVVPYAYKSAILKGNTKYRDIDTEEILETFEEGRNLELVTVKMPVLTTSNEDGTKTNILSCNEEVELCAIGDVKDELDLLTGELTERIGEVVLDENTAKNFTLSAISNNTVSFWCMHNATSPFVNIQRGEDLKTLLTDKIPRKSNFNEDVELIHSGTGAVVLRILKNKLQTLDVNGLTLYLQSNPITVQYKLEPESVRTVDLNIQDQNGKTLSVIKPIEGKMFVSTSGVTIKPLFTGEIPVEAIKQNLASFIGLEMEE